MKTDIQVNGTSMKIAIEGRLDTLTAPELQAELDNYKLGELMEIVLDLSKLEYIASAGLRAFRNFNLAMRRGGKDYRMKNVPKTIMEVFEMTGYIRLLRM